jgi:hypothetical protein
MNNNNCNNNYNNMDQKSLICIIQIKIEMSLLLD